MRYLRETIWPAFEFEGMRFFEFFSSIRIIYLFRLNNINLFRSISILNYLADIQCLIINKFAKRKFILEYFVVIFRIRECLMFRVKNCEMWKKNVFDFAHRIWRTLGWAKRYYSILYIIRCFMMCLSQLDNAPEKPRLKNQESFRHFSFFISDSTPGEFWKSFSRP